MACLLVLGYSMLVSFAAEASSDIENQVKAQFVYNFANYVTWPDSAFAREDSSLEVCLFGNVEFEGYLRAFEGVIIGSRELSIRTTTKLQDIQSGCHMLFVSEHQRIRLPTFWNKISYHYVLSVGEKSEFSEKGGIISIFRDQGRVQFDVNISNAINNGLFVDSDLLSLARTIRRNTEARPDEHDGGS